MPRLFSALPLELQYHILTYNRNFVLKNGKLVEIKRIDPMKYALLRGIPRIIILDDDISEVVLPIQNLTHFFCLLSTNYNGVRAMELQKLASEHGNTYFLDYITHVIL
jgi:hypothetical protein